MKHFAVFLNIFNKETLTISMYKRATESFSIREGFSIILCMVKGPKLPNVLLGTISDGETLCFRVLHRTLKGSLVIPVRKPLQSQCITLQQRVLCQRRFLNDSLDG